jgi:hypothetical protein
LSGTVAPSRAARTAKRSPLVRAFAVSFISIAGAACEGAPVRSANDAAKTQPPTPTVAPPTLTRQLRRLGFLPLSLLLPDAEGWVTERDELQRYDARHVASASTLTAELLDGSFGSSVQCARTQLPATDRARSLIDEGSVRAPLALEVAFEAFAEEREGGVVSGSLVAYTAVAGRCTRLRFETRARGTDAAGEVGARLAFFRDVSLSSILVVREGHPPLPSRSILERRKALRYG